MYIPKTIMSGYTLHYKRHLSLKIGQYSQVQEKDTPRNIQYVRTKAVIRLGLSVNTKDGFKFMSIHSADRITRRIWDVVPMPDTTISRVNDLSKGKTKHSIFIYLKGYIIGDADLTGVDINVNQQPQKNKHLIT